MKRSTAIVSIVVALLVGVALGAVARQPTTHTVVRTRTVTRAVTKVPQSCIDSIRGYLTFTKTVLDQFDTLGTTLGRQVSLAPTEEFTAQLSAQNDFLRAINAAAPSHVDLSACAATARKFGTSP